MLSWSHGQTATCPGLQGFPTPRREVRPSPRDHDALDLQNGRRMDARRICGRPVRLRIAHRLERRGRRPVGLGRRGLRRHDRHRGPASIGPRDGRRRGLPLRAIGAPHGRRPRSSSLPTARPETGSDGRSSSTATRSRSRLRCSTAPARPTSRAIRARSTCSNGPVACGRSRRSSSRAARRPTTNLASACPSAATGSSSARTTAGSRTRTPSESRSCSNGRGASGPRSSRSPRRASAASTTSDGWSRSRTIAR